MTIINRDNAHFATINTTVATLNLGDIQFSADRRTTKEQKLTDAERIRRVVIPGTAWNPISANLGDTFNQSLTDILRSALIAIGNDRLRDLLAGDPMAREVNLADFSIASLLAWNAETASGRGSITFTREQVETWFDSSNTMLALQLKLEGNPKSAAILSFARNRFATLAAKNHGLKSADDATKLTAMIDADDLEGESASLVTEIIGRLEHIKKAFTARANEETISFDDL